MNEYELIDTARGGLNYAERSMNKNDHAGYAAHMSTVLNLLLAELVGDAPGNPNKPLPERSKS